MKSYSSRKVISILKADGWYEIACDGDHHQFKHPVKKRESNGYASEERHTNRNHKKYQ